MKQIYNFDAAPPPALTERTLQAELERRTRRRQTVLLAVAGWLLQIAVVLAAALVFPSYPLLAAASICYIFISIAGSGAVAVVWAQKGGNL